MSSLTIEEIAFRAAILWVLGQFAVAVISAYTARPWREGRVSGWIIIPILVAQGLVLLGPTGLVLILGRATNELGEIVATALLAAAFVLSYWMSLIIVQVGQNVGYRLVGAPVQKMRWWAGTRRNSRRSRTASKDLDRGR